MNVRTPDQAAMNQAEMAGPDCQRDDDQARHAGDRVERAGDWTGYARAAERDARKRSIMGAQVIDDSAGSTLTTDRLFGGDTAAETQPTARPTTPPSQAPPPNSTPNNPTPHGVALAALCF